MKKLLTLFIVLCCVGKSISQEAAEQQQVLDSLSAVLKNARHDTTRASVYISLCEILYFSNPDTVWSLSKKAEEIARKNLALGQLNQDEKRVYYRMLSSAFNNYGLMYERNEKFSEALTAYKKSLALEEKWGNVNGAAISRSNLGLFYLNQGDIQNATAMFFENLKRRDQIAKKPMCYTLNNLGYLYNLQNDTANALKYYRQCLELSKEIDFKNSYANCASNIGIIYIGSKQYEKALKLFVTSRIICKETGDEESEAIALNNIGGVYQKTGRFREALEAFDEALKMLEKLNAKKYIAYTLSLQGGTYLEKLEVNKALGYLERSYNLSIELGYPENIKRSAELLHKAYRLSGNYKKSLEAYETFIKMRDSLDNAENNKIAAQKELQYEYEKKEAEVKAATKVEKEKTAAINQEEKEKQQLVIYSVIAGLLLVIVFAVFMYNRFRITQQQKKLIELKEKETQQQKHLVEEKHKEITDSIHYAERIQRSFLATKKMLDENLEEYFVFFQPKEAVSGDFYWGAVLNNGAFVLAVADSTGHGVPGAIMSILNITCLDNAIKEGAQNPAEILNHTRNNVIQRLKKDGSPEGGKDGMDCALLSFDRTQNKLHFALANNPLWIIRNHQLIEYKPDKMPVGRHDREKELFTPHETEIQKGDLIFALTDGYADQFGGDKGKKFKYVSLQKLLVEQSHKTLPEIHAILGQAFEQWKGSLEQIDDVTIVGIRI